MFQPQFSITQERCNELIIKDITPAYSPLNTGGYGGYNIEASQVKWTYITIDFGRGQVIRLEKEFNQASGEWRILAEDIAYQFPEQSGCHECDSHSLFEKNEFGFLKTFPSGCATFKFELFSQGENPLDKVSVGTKVLRIISICHEQNLMIKLADRFTLSKDCSGYNFFDTKEIRETKMRNLILAWQKLKLLDNEKDGCDCDCIADQIKQVGNFLKTLE